MGIWDYADSVDYYFRPSAPRPVVKPITNRTIFILGLFLFTFGFYFLAAVLRWLLPRKYSRAVILDVSNKTMSAIQAITSSIAGALIVRHCWHDMMGCRHYLADSYPYFILGYGLYDTWCMFHVHWAKLKLHRPAINCRDGLVDFFHERPLMIFHHLFLLIFAFPAVAWFRNDRGDFILGCFFLCELSTPFVCVRAIFLLLDMKHSTLFLLNGALMILTFLCCRVLSFPFMFWFYARYAHVTVLDVPWHIPKKCTASCCIILSMQLYWMGLMLKGAAKVLMSAPNAPPTLDGMSGTCSLAGRGAGAAVGDAYDAETVADDDGQMAGGGTNNGQGRQGLFTNGAKDGLYNRPSSRSSERAKTGDDDANIQPRGTGEQSNRSKNA